MFGVAVGAGDLHAAQVVVLDVFVAVLGSECGRDSGRSGGGDELTGSDLTLHGDQRRWTWKGGTKKTYQAIATRHGRPPSHAHEDGRREMSAAPPALAEIGGGGSYRHVRRRSGHDRRDLWFDSWFGVSGGPTKLLGATLQ